MTVRVSREDKRDGDAGAGDAVAAFTLRLRVMLKKTGWGVVEGRKTGGS